MPSLKEMKAALKAKGVSTVTCITKADITALFDEHCCGASAETSPPVAAATTEATTTSDGGGDADADEFYESFDTPGAAAADGVPVEAAEQPQ